MILFADTNILLDLQKIDLLKAFFLLKNQICIEQSIFYDELLEPKGIQEELLENGLLCVSMNDDEFTLARKVYEENPKLSFYDCVAFAVAKCREWDLMTGDKRLRRYAEQHQVKVYGLLWAVKKCEDEMIDVSILLKALNTIYHEPRIRVPSTLVMAMYLGMGLTKYRGSKKSMDYYVCLEACGG